MSKFTFILAKLIPYWIAGLIILTIGILLARVVYGLSPAGPLWLLYFFALLFIVVISGMGLVVSNYSQTMQQAMFVMVFFPYYHYADEWFVYTYQQYAPMGTNHHHLKPFKIFYPSHQNRISEGKQLGRPDCTVYSAAHNGGHLEHLGCI